MGRGARDPAPSTAVILLTAALGATCWPGRAGAGRVLGVVVHDRAVVSHPAENVQGPTQPECSIIVPVFNDPHLLEALGSLRTQSVVGWEAIVVDDGSSTDAAEHQVEQLGDSRIRFVRHAANRGLAAARNTGIQAARSSIIVPLDSDDMLAPGYLARVLPFLAPDSPYNCAFTDFEGFGHRNGLIRQGYLRHEGVVSYEPEELISLLRHQWIPAGGGAFRRSLWTAIGGYCEDPVFRVGNEDQEFFVGALEVGLNPIYIAEPLYRYRLSDESMMSRLRPEVWRTHMAIVARHREVFDRHGATRGFLADGFVRSGMAQSQLGHRRTAIRLALRALRLEPWRLDGMLVVARSLTPAPILDLLFTGRRTLGSLRRRLHAT